MDKLITFISNFQGIFGTLLGVIVTFIVTQLGKRSGKINFYFYDYQMIYYGTNENGFVEEIEDVSKADYCQYKVRVQLYNSSEIVKVLKDFQMLFVLENKIIYDKPNNEKETLKDVIHSEYKDFNFINIKPKELTEIIFSGNMRNEDMIAVSKTKKVFLLCQNQKNTNIRKLIRKF